MTVQSYIEIDDVFFDYIEARVLAIQPELTQLSGSTVPVRFFNKQKQLKDKPTYPELVIQPFMPQEREDVRNDHGVSRRADLVAGGYDDAAMWESEAGVTHFIFQYQVSAFTNDFRQSREMHYLLAQRMFPRQHGMRWLTVDDKRNTLFIEERTSTPVLKDGVFQDVFLYKIYITLYEEPLTAGLRVTGITTTTTIAD